MNKLHGFNIARINNNDAGITYKAELFVIGKELEHDKYILEDTITADIHLPNEKVRKFKTLGGLIDYAKIEIYCWVELFGMVQKKLHKQYLQGKL
jgi:hypothetical protein